MKFIPHHRAMLYIYLSSAYHSWLYSGIIPRTFS